MKTAADYYSTALPTVRDALVALSGREDVGVYSDGSFISWSCALNLVEDRIAILRARLSPRLPLHVGVLLDNVPEFVWLLGAASCSDLVIVALNSTRSPEGLRRDCALADCQLVISSSAFSHKTGEAGVPVIEIDSSAWKKLTSSRPPRKDINPFSHCPAANDLVALVFTSGTSGDPKAVRITQRKIALPGVMLAERFSIDQQSCIYCAMPLFHSNSIMAAWSTAVFGGASIALRARFSASGWLEDIRRYGCDFANYVGTPLSYILATPAHSNDSDNPLKVMYGNEASAEDRSAFAERFDCSVIDGFGSTEGGVSISRTPQTPPAALGVLSPGTHVVNERTGLVSSSANIDDDGQLCNPDEAIGELVSDGPGLFAGYYNDPDADAERMRGGRFHSGDLAYIDDDGFVYFAGRTSGWMRVRGENLVTAPIERALLRHPAIAELSVYSIPSDAVGDCIMVAIVATQHNRDGGFMDGFGSFLLAQRDLSSLQWPSYIRLATELPRTASFKVVARTLSAQALEVSDPIWEREGRGATYIPLSRLKQSR